MRRSRLPGSVVVGGYGGVPVGPTSSPYAQPVIYIHPDSLSTGYPISALGVGGISAAYPGVNQTYASSIETLYTPYSRDARHGKLKMKLRFLLFVQIYLSLSTKVLLHC